MITIDKKSKIYENAFYSVFKSMQLSGHYVLFYDMEWSKDEIVAFQSECTDVNQKIVDGTLHEKDMETMVKNTVEFDCRLQNSKFPYRTKIKMCEVKYSQKQTPTVAAAVNDACGVYFILASYTLVKKHDFTREQLNEWYEKLEEFCWLYTTGMRDHHVLKYFSQEADLTITEDY